jgi:hypothetical protein|uniref:YABBY protein C-terminal domain-containing protein n=1 Tax=viral metagenome TaxID=1070528 RepID=A0A6C0JQ86_9ZZZZ
MVKGGENLQLHNVALTGGAKKKKAKAKAKRKPTAYNTFMKNEIKKVKKANPTISHTEAFKRAAANWNPKK